MIDVIDILQNRKSRDFSCDSGKKALWLLCVIAYHHELIVKLGEERLNSFSELLISPDWRTPVLLVEPIRDFKGDMRHIEQVLLNVCAEIPLVPKHEAVVIFPLHILEVVEVMNVGGCHVITMDDSAYSAYSVELISIIMHALGSAIPPGGSQVWRILAHGTACGSCILTDFDRLGVNAEHIFVSIHGSCNILPYFFAKEISLLASLVILTTCREMRKLAGAFILQTMKQVVFTVYAEDLRRGGKRDDFQIRELGDNTSAGHIPQFIDTISGKILVYAEYFSELYDEVVHMRDDSNQWFGHH